MFKKLFIAAAILAVPTMTSAATLSAIYDTSASIAAVDKSQSSDLAGVGSFTTAPLLVTDDDFGRAQYISPFLRGDNVTDFWAVGQKFAPGLNERKKIFDATANSDTPAVLVLDRLMQSVSFLWGSPDGDNTVSLYRNATLVQTFTGADFAIPSGSTEQLGKGAFLTTLTADDEGENFNSIQFGTRGQTFEFASISAVAPVPVPAALPMALGAFGVLAFVGRRRSKAKTA